MFFIAPPDFEGHHHPPPPAFERSAYESHRTTTIIIPPAVGVNEALRRPRRVPALAQRGRFFSCCLRIACSFGDEEQSAQPDMGIGSWPE
jgi:hypothetical protein